MKKQGVLIFLMIAMMLSAAAAQADALVVYFSMPEDVVLDGVDAIGGASVLEKNGVRYGTRSTAPMALSRASCSVRLRRRKSTSGS